MIFAMVFFSACAAMMWHEATTTRRGVVIEEVIHLDRGQARTFFGVLAAMSIGFVVLGAYSTIRLARGTLHIDLDDDGITLPGRLLRPQPRRFAWRTITSVRTHNIYRQVLLSIAGAEGKGSIGKSTLPDAEFDQIVALIAQRVPPERAQLPAARAVR
jgi:hypothetical protein